MDLFVDIKLPLHNFNGILNYLTGSRQYKNFNIKFMFMLQFHIFLNAIFRTVHYQFWGYQDRNFEVG